MKEDLYFLWIKWLIQNDEWKFLLLKWDRSKWEEINPIRWDLPWGRVDTWENVLDTLSREIREETGITNIKIWKHLDMTISPMRIREYGLILSIYIVHLLEESKIILSDEHIDYGRFEKDEALKLLEIKYPKEFLEEMKEKM